MEATEQDSLLLVNRFLFICSSMMFVELIFAIVFAFLTATLYLYEAFVLGRYAPGSFSKNMLGLRFSFRIMHVRYSEVFNQTCTLIQLSIMSRGRLRHLYF